MEKHGVMQLPVARSLAEAFARLKAAQELTRGPMPESIEQFYKDAFYVGAASIWDLVMHAPEFDPNDPDDEPGARVLSAIQAELEGYVSARVAIVFPVRGRAQ